GGGGGDIGHSGVSKSGSGGHGHQFIDTEGVQRNGGGGGGGGGGAIFGMNGEAVNGYGGGGGGAASAADAGDVGGAGGNGVAEFTFSGGAITRIDISPSAPTVVAGDAA